MICPWCLVELGTWIEESRGGWYYWLLVRGEWYYSIDDNCPHCDKPIKVDLEENQVYKIIVGEYVAPDGYKMIWDSQPVGYIKFYGVDGICKNHISGQIEEKDVERSLKKFKKDHSGQMRLL